MAILSNTDIEYIRNNYQRQSTNEMARHLNRNIEYVRRFMREDGLQTLYNKKLKEGKLTEEQQQFIRNSYRNLSATEMATKLKVDRTHVYNFLYHEKLVLVKKDAKCTNHNINFYAKKVTFERPPAVYSNKQWS
jgi:hypothetical protein